MSDVAQPERPASSTPGYAPLNAGDHCPACTIGILYTIAEGDDAITLRCFNCNRQGSHAPSVGYQVHTFSPQQTPTGFTLSKAQHAAKNADDPDKAAADALQPEAGSGIRTEPVGGESG